MKINWQYPRAAIFLAAICVAPALLWFYGPRLGPQITYYAEFVFKIFKNLWVAPAVAAAMVILALTLLGLYGLLYVYPVRKSIKGFRSRIDKFSDYHSFTDAFDEIDEAAKRNPLIAHGWQEFTETLVPPDDSEPYYRNTVRPHNFINAVNIKGETTALSIMESLPGYFVGFGLLFTFLGLLAALFFASGTVSSPDVKEAQQGLQDLLSAATFKFWTSVAGLFCSMLLSFFFRLFDRMIDGACMSLCRSIEDKLRFVSMQDLGNKMARTLRQQLDESKKINTEVAFTIGKTVSDALESKLPAALASTMQPLVNEVRQASERMGSMGESGVGNMVKEFSEKLQGAAGEEMKQLGQTLGVMQSTLGDLGSSIDKITKEFSASASQSRVDLEMMLADVRQTLSVASQRLGADLNAAASNAASAIEEGAANLIAGLRTEITGLTDSLGQMERTFQTQASSLMGAAEQSNKAADAFSRVATDLRAASQPISHSTQQLATAGERVASAVEAVTCPL